MFESDLDQEQIGGPTNRRRAFLGSAVAAIAGLIFWQWRKPRLVETVAAATTPKEVTVVLFSDAGERLKQVRIAKVVKTADEWRKQLSPNAYDITRNADTEMAFSGKYWNLEEKGLFRCICCDNALFDSATKFDSGTGWPSFWQPIAQQMSPKYATQRLAWCALQSRAPNATRISGTSSTMALRPPIYATA